MILYFSATGNSAYVAERIGRETGEETTDLFARLRGRDSGALTSERAWVVVAPTYAWRIPRLVEKHLRETELSGNRSVYFVLTCGDAIGNAGKYLEKFCRDKGLTYMGCREVVMPENYLAMFETPGKEEAREIVDRAEGRIAEIAALIAGGKPFPAPRVRLSDRVLSGMVNRMFYPACVHARKFFATDACVSCGRCVAVCPLGNIRLEAGKPLWGKSCTHCMACINRCPKEAIEYGGKSKGRHRYTCPK